MSGELSGRCCVVTGASSGIGLSIAQQLAHLGADLILVCRSADRGQVAIDRIRQTAAPTGKLQLITVDLAEQRDVRRAAAEIQRFTPAVHVLVNNVGAVYSDMQLTPDGVERQHAINCVNQFLLTRLLLPALQQGSRAEEPSRVVCVCSKAHRRARWNPERLTGGGRYVTLLVYRHSKLAQALFATELSRRLRADRVTVNSCCPGFVRTDIGAKHASPMSRFLWRLAAPFSKTPDEGALTPAYLAAAPEVRGITGKFFELCQSAGYGSAALSTKSANELWTACCRLTGLDENLSAMEQGDSLPLTPAESPTVR